jgi:D-beta-D-heptose 7-phosphate kinase/D-beta-D-heptose 1-phosphate adenosyltransferase
VKTSTADSADIVAKFREAAVAIVGDVMLDTFVYGSVARISPEAPVPVFCRERQEVMAGAAGNVACNISAMGGRAYLVGIVGTDEAGETLQRLIGADRGVVMKLISDSTSATTTKTRFVAGGQHVLRVDVDTSPELSDSNVRKKLWTCVEDVLLRSNTLVLSDYMKGTLDENGLSRAIKAARARNARVVVDPKHPNSSRYLGATLVAPNVQEASRMTGINCCDDDSTERAAVEIASVIGCEAVVITRGRHIPTHARDVYDVSGAGDIVTAVLALSLSVGAPLLEGARLANLAAGLAVARRGTTVITSMDLQLAKQGAPYFITAEKVISGQDIEAIVRHWRREGSTIVLTNGCFDMLHAGHVELIRRAKVHGDRLIVALNSDISVRRLKGAGRPIQDEASRAAVIASLAAVDLVVVFAEDTPLDLIETIRPDILVKGADYTMDQVIGADLVRSYGGRVALEPLVGAYSTSAILQRIITPPEIS